MGSGVRVYGLGFRVKGLGFRVCGLGVGGWKSLFLRGDGSCRGGVLSVKLSSECGSYTTAKAIF